MKYLNYFKLFESNDFESIVDNIDDILVDLKDMGLYIRVINEGEYIDIVISNVIGKYGVSTPDDLIKQIKDYYERVIDYMKSEGFLEVAYTRQVINYISNKYKFNNPYINYSGHEKKPDRIMLDNNIFSNKLEKSNFPNYLKPSFGIWGDLSCYTKFMRFDKV
jgi:hypothetical protein